MRKVKDSLEAALQRFGELMSGASMRAQAGVKHLGEIASVFVGDDSSAGIQVDDNKRDVWLTVTDVLSGLKETARLYIPAQVLFRLPRKGDGAHHIRGRKQRGPGASLAIPDGGDGSTAIVPGWDDGTNLDNNNSGIKLPEGWHIESTGDRLRFVANSGGTKSILELQKGGSIILTSSTGQTIQLDGNTYSAVLGEILQAYLNAHTHGTPVGPSSPPVNPLPANALSNNVKLT